MITKEDLRQELEQFGKSFGKSLTKELTVVIDRKMDEKNDGLAIMIQKEFRAIYKNIHNHEARIDDIESMTKKLESKIA